MLSWRIDPSRDEPPPGQGRSDPARDENEDDIELPNGRADVAVEGLLVFCRSLHYDTAGGPVFIADEWNVKVERGSIGSVGIRGCQGSGSFEAMKGLLWLIRTIMMIVTVFHST
jgi:hypothetical protein